MHMFLIACLSVRGKKISVMCFNNTKLEYDKIIKGKEAKNILNLKMLVYGWKEMCLLMPF